MSKKLVFSSMNSIILLIFHQSLLNLYVHINPRKLTNTVSKKSHEDGVGTGDVNLRGDGRHEDKAHNSLGRIRARPCTRVYSSKLRARASYARA